MKFLEQNELLFNFMLVNISSVGSATANIVEYYIKERRGNKKNKKYNQKQQKRYKIPEQH